MLVGSTQTLCVHTLLWQSSSRFNVVVDANTKLSTFMRSSYVFAVCMFQCLTSFISNVFSQQHLQPRLLATVATVVFEHCRDSVGVCRECGRLTTCADTAHTSQYLLIYLQPSLLLIRERRCPPSCKHLLERWKKENYCAFRLNSVAAKETGDADVCVAR
jgi:hypothetical protein